MQVVAKAGFILYLNEIFLNHFQGVHDELTSQRVCIEAVSSAAQDLLDSSMGNVGVVSEATRITSEYQMILLKNKVRKFPAFVPAVKIMLVIFVKSFQ